MTILSATRYLVSFIDASGHGVSVLGTVSGSTVSVDASNTFTTQAGNPISSCLLTGSNGMITFRGTGSEMAAVTFSYSGATLNQSTETAYSSTSGNVKNVQSPNGMLVPVDSTHAISMWYNTGSTALQAMLLGSTGYNNLTTGTQYTITSAIPSADINYANIGLASNGKITGLTTDQLYQCKRYLYEQGIINDS